jgi:hypothetical protein
VIRLVGCKKFVRDVELSGVADFFEKLPRDTHVIVLKHDPLLVVYGRRSIGFADCRMGARYNFSV